RIAQPDQLAALCCESVDSIAIRIPRRHFHRAPQVIGGQRMSDEHVNLEFTRRRLRSFLFYTNPVCDCLRLGCEDRNGIRMEVKFHSIITCLQNSLRPSLLNLGTCYSARLRVPKNSQADKPDLPPILCQDRLARERDFSENPSLVSD